jgi:peptidoglycan/xylan/chitin deacetylase (PgdA/CDA1 family)
LDRRQFISSLASSSLALAARGLAQQRKQIAITMDDPQTNTTALLSPSERNTAILETLGKANLKAALFVCGMRVDDESGLDLLQQWDRAGHVLGNHTYSHPYLPSSDVSVESYIDDIARGEKVVAALPQFQRLFRFPFLKEGNTIDKRDGVRSFLSKRGYRIGHVTIDASDWYVDGRMAARLKVDPGADLSPYRDFYLQHLWDRAKFYDDLSTQVLDRPVRHTLLVHHGLLNALFLEDVIDMFESRGWQWVNASDAFDDDIFSEVPDIVPAGESIVWALAKQTGSYEDLLRYPGEDSVYEEAAMDQMGL